MPGMWYELERIFAEDGVHIGMLSSNNLGVGPECPADKMSSVFVGDAAGRSADHASTDRKWALNAEIPFYTPEVRDV